jgi:hypothetical protein
MTRVIGWMAIGLAMIACGRPAVTSPTSNPEVPLRTIYGTDSMRLVAYEYYGWRSSQRFSRGLAPIVAATDAPEHLFDMEGCHGGRYEYSGWQPFVTCDGSPPTGPTKLTQPIELLFEHEGCLVYRFEYYGWHDFARCGLSGGPPPPSKLTEPVRFLFASEGCRAFAFEYYGWHTVVHCDDAGGPIGPDPASALTEPVEAIFEAGGCRTSRFEYYGWSHFTRCPGGLPTTFTRNTERYKCGDSWCSREYDVQVTSTAAPVRW